MNNIAIDTNVYAAFKNEDLQVIETFRHCERIGIDVTVLAELFSGFAMGNREQQNREDLEEFLKTPRVSILHHDQQTAEYYARIVKHLKNTGRPIPTNDIWIAANAMKHALALYSFDEHFKNVAGLPVFP
jgi:predicted nucleic acid-binding protein